MISFQFKRRTKNEEAKSFMEIASIIVIEEEKERKKDQLILF